MDAPNAGGRALRLGSRRSPMAMSQSRRVADLLTERTGRAVELVGITTFGDVSRAQMAQIGGTGVFVSALRESLVSGEVDFAVHSLKDLPTAQPAGIVLAAVPPRDDPRDALVARDGIKLADLPGGARIGTGSPRRAAQLLLLREDIEVVPIRGNANTRMDKVLTGELDAVVLACAGLNRIGHLDAISQIFEPEEMLPDPGQGALAVECRADDAGLTGLLAAIDDAPTRSAVLAERTLLAALEAGCSAPVGAFATLGAGTLRLEGAVFGGNTAGGIGVLRDHGADTPEEAERLGRALAEQMLARGAAGLMAAPFTGSATD
ncbi:MAG: hydroxymethylbilane synthase [Streptosporangiaceae bacterium]